MSTSRREDPTQHSGSPDTEVAEFAPELFAQCYPELKRIAHSRLMMAGRSATLDTTALVHDAYMKLANLEGFNAKSRAHFIGYAANTMRSIIVDAIRSRAAAIHGGDSPHLSLDTDLGEQLGRNERDVLDIHLALEQLSKVDPRIVRIVEMRYFAGFTDKEIADSLGVTTRTVYRDWQRARALLSAALGA
jgi:RNA polymerase sigma factor (TIGR02999 family)